MGDSLSAKMIRSSTDWRASPGNAPQGMWRLVLYRYTYTCSDLSRSVPHFYIADSFTLYCSNILLCYLIGALDLSPSPIRLA